MHVRELESGKLVQSLLLSGTAGGDNSNRSNDNRNNIRSSHGSSSGGVTSISASSNGRVVTSYDNG